MIWMGVLVIGDLPDAATPSRQPPLAVGRAKDGRFGGQIPEIGGLGRNRTGVHGFAVRCVTTPPRGRREARYLNVRSHLGKAVECFFERSS